MKIRSVLMLVVMVTFTTTLFAQDKKSSRGEIQEIINQIKSGQIARVVVFQSTGIMTNHRMAPNTLTHSYTRKLDYQIRTQAQKDALILLLRNLKVSKDTHGADVRVGIVFAGSQPIDNREDWKYGIFSDEFGKYGYIGRIGNSWQLDDREERGIKINRELWNFASQLFTTIDH